MPPAAWAACSIAAKSAVWRQAVAMAWAAASSCITAWKTSRFSGVS